MSEKATHDQSKILKDLQKLWGPITQANIKKPLVTRDFCTVLYIHVCKCVVLSGYSVRQGDYIIKSYPRWPAAELKD